MLMYEEKHALYISSLVLPTLRAYVCGNLKSTQPLHTGRIAKRWRCMRRPSNVAIEHRVGHLKSKRSDGEIKRRATGVSCNTERPRAQSPPW
jgi:hypothetical protein